MKKSTVVILIVALCLFVSGVIICGGVLTMSDAFGSGFENKGNVSYAERTETITEKFVNVDVDAVSGSVELFPSSADECKVECSESEGFYFDIRTEGDTLKVKRVDTGKWFRFFDFSKEYVKVYLPQGTYEDISLGTISGKVVVNDGLSCNNLWAKSNSGSVRVYSLNAAGTVKLYTTSGSVAGDTIKANELTASSASGKATIGNVEVAGAMEVGCTSGKIEVSNADCNSFNAKNNSGSITLSDVISATTLRAKNTSGKIEVLGCDGQNLDLSSVSGSIRGTILTDKVFVADSTSGRVRVSDTTQGGVCKAHTVSGSIDLEVK